MQNDKLLPCPFCGYHGTLHSIDMCNTVYAVCMKCGSRTLDFEKAEEAIASWNTRKPVERIADRLEEMFKHHSATKTVQRLVLETVKDWWCR